MRSEPKPEYEKIVKDPYAMEFLQIKPDPHVYESDIEQALLDHLQQFLLELGRGFFIRGTTKTVFTGRTRLFY